MGQIVKRFSFLFILFLLLFKNFSWSAESNTPTLVFIHIGDHLPDHLEASVRQARLFNPDSPIILVANQQAFTSLSPLLQLQQLLLIPCESLIPTAEHIAFRQAAPQAGFWLYTSERFLYLYDLMAQYQLKDVFHLENDNMLYANLKELLPIFHAHYPGIGATFHNDELGIAGFIYAATPEAMRSLAWSFANYVGYGFNDMQQLIIFKNLTNRSAIDYLPTIPSTYAQKYPLQSLEGHTVKEPERFSHCADLFQSLFDAAAIGQYLGGGDIFFHAYAKPGFVNPSSIFNPSFFSYEWRQDSLGRKIPYAIFDGKSYRINNIHVHSKLLYQFYSYRE